MTRSQASSQPRPGRGGGCWWSMDHPARRGGAWTLRSLDPASGQHQPIAGAHPARVPRGERPLARERDPGGGPVQAAVSVSGRDGGRGGGGWSGGMTTTPRHSRRYTRSASTPWTWQRGTIPWCHTERVAERHRMCDLWLHGHPAARRADVTAMVPSWVTGQGTLGYAGPGASCCVETSTTGPPSQRCRRWRVHNAPSTWRWSPARR